MRRRRAWSGDYRTPGYYRANDNDDDKFYAEQARKRHEVEESSQAMATNKAGTSTEKDGALVSMSRAGSRDGKRDHAQCPQLRDDEPNATGRHCLLDHSEGGHHD